MPLTHGARWLIDPVQDASKASHRAPRRLLRLRRGRSVSRATTAALTDTCRAPALDRYFAHAPCSLRPWHANCKPLCDDVAVVSREPRVECQQRGGPCVGEEEEGAILLLSSSCAGHYTSRLVSAIPGHRLFSACCTKNPLCIVRCSRKHAAARAQPIHRTPDNIAASPSTWTRTKPSRDLTDTPA
jgi:hypothetical protein